MKKTVLALGLMMSGFWAVAQDAAQIQPPEWSLEVGGKVEWMKQAETGTIVAFGSKKLIGSANQLTGIDPITHKIAWTYDLPKATAVIEVKPEDLQFIPDSPYMIFSRSIGLSEAIDIIDYITGESVYKSEGIKIEDQTPLFSIGAMLLQYRKDKMGYVGLLDLKQKKEIWNVPLGKRSGLKGIIKLAFASLSPNPILDKDNNILFPTDNFLYRIDSKTGAVLWKIENDDIVGKLETSENGDVVYYGGGRRINGATLSDGKGVWKDPFKVPGDFKYFVPMKGKTLLVVTKGGVTRIDEATGQSVWKKPNYVNLPLQEIRYLKSGMLVLSSSEDKSQFDFIDYNGKDLWKRAYKADKPVVDFQITPKGILYTNAEEADVISFDNGDSDVWKKRIKVKRQPVMGFDKANNKMLLYTNEKLYVIDLTDVSYKLLAEDINFRGNDEDVRKIETRADGYVLSSNQNIWKIGFDGKKIYDHFYREAGTAKRAFSRIAGIGASLAGSYLISAGSTNAMSGLANSIVGNEEIATRDMKKASDQVEAASVARDISPAFNMMASQRNKATVVTKDIFCTLTAIEVEGSVKRSGMVKVNKDSGAETGCILLKDLTPIYIQDDIENVLYVMVGDNNFYCYKL